LVLGAMGYGAAVAAPVAAPASAANSPVATVSAANEPDCQKVGGDVSALIDTKRSSPNISAARAAFQAGIMECMEGDDPSANKLYQDAKKLLSSDQSAPVATSKR